MTPLTPPSCHHMGTPWVQLVCESTRIKGFIARDDHRKEIVIALRGRRVPSFGI